MADEILLPNSTVSNSGWTEAGAATLHECLDEGCDVPNGDTDRIFCAPGPGGVGASCRLGLTSPAGAVTPSQEHTLRFAARRQGDATLGEPVLTVRLFDGVTQVVAAQVTLSPTWTVYTRPLTAGEIALISSYPNLELVITVVTLPTDGQSIRVTAADLLIEEEPPPSNPPEGLVPDSLVSNTGWTATGAASEFEATNEGVELANDVTDYVGTTTASAQLRMGLSNPVSPPSPTVKHFARVRARRSGAAGTGEPTLNVRFTSAGTPAVAYSQVLTGGMAWTTYEHELTVTEVALLTDYDAIDVLLIANTLTVAGQGIDVSAVDLFISDESSVPPDAESIVPDSTVSNTGWTAVGAATLHESLDEGFMPPNPNDDVDRMFADTVGATCRLGFTDPLETPSSFNVHKLRVRARRQGLGTLGEPTINVRLLSGVTQFLQVQMQLTGGGTWTTYERELTAGEIAAIGGVYTAIEGIVVADAIPSAGDSIRISAIDLFMPEAPRTPEEADRIFPDATIAAVGWSTVGAGSAHAALDDNPDDHDADATYSTASTVGSLLTLGLSNPAVIPSPSLLRVLRIVARRDGTDLAGEPAVNVKLRTNAGATEIISGGFNVTMTAGDTYAVYQTILTGQQTALLPADLADLRVVLELTANPTPGSSVRVTAVDLAFLDDIPGAYIVADGGADLDYSEGAAPGYETRLNVFLPAVIPSSPAQRKPVLITFFCSGLATTDRRYVITGHSGDGLEKLTLDAGWGHIECSLLHAASKIAPGSSTPIPGGGRFRDPRLQEFLDYWSPLRCVARAIQYVRKLCEPGGLLYGYCDPDQIYDTGRSGGGHMALGGIGMREFAGAPGMDSRSSKAQGGVINAVAFPWWGIALQSNWSQLALYFDGPGGVDTAAAAFNEIQEDRQAIASFLRYAFDDTIAGLPGEAVSGFIGNKAKTLARAIYLRATEIDEGIPYDNGELLGEYNGNHAKNQLVMWPHSIWGPRNIAIEMRQAGGKVNGPGEPVQRGYSRVSTDSALFNPAYDSVSIQGATGAATFSETDPVVLDERDFLLAQENAAPLALETVEERILQHLQASLEAISKADGYYTDVRTVTRSPGTVVAQAQCPQVNIAVEDTGISEKGVPEDEVLDAVSCLLRVRLIGSLSGAGTASVLRTELQRFLADLKTAAVDVDHTRGGDAIHTRVVGQDRLYPVDSGDSIQQAYLDLEIYYRTAFTDATVAV